MTTFKTGSVLTTGTGVGDTQPGFNITFGPTAGVGVLGFVVNDFLNAPIFGVPKHSNGTIACYGDFNSAFKNVITGAGMRIDGQRGPECLNFPASESGTTQAHRTWCGTDAPQRVISITSSTNAGDTLTATGHGLPATATPVIFTAKSGLSESATITLNTVTYYAKQVTDANTLQIYSNSSLSTLITIGADGGTATMYINNVGGAGALGDNYWRRDTPSTSNQRLYVCTTAGTPATWTGRL